MKILKRVVDGDYCFTEITFESLEEYEKEYGNFVKTHYDLKQREQKFKEKLNQEEPFKS